MKNIVPVPTHIPSELVRDFDYFSVLPVDGDLHKGWAKLHGDRDIFWTPRNGGHWVFTRADDIQEAYRTPDLFSSRVVAIPYVDTGFRFGPAEFDPPEVDDYRTALGPAFTPKALKSYEAIVRDLTISLIERLVADGSCDFQLAVSQHLPIGVFLGMMDFPAEDAAMLLPLVEAQTRSADPAETQRSMDAMIAYLGAKIDERVANLGDDLTSQVLRSTIGGQPANRQQVFSMLINLMFAGLDTVVAELGFSMRYLATHPQHQQMLIDRPELIPNAVEELLRYHGITNLARVVREDQEFRGITMKAGEPVLLSTTLFGLDERRFADPLTIDFERTDVAHMIFGSGPHRCLGSHLARLELRTFFMEWFARVGRFELDPGAQVVVSSGKNNAMVALPLRWTPPLARAA